MTVAPNNYDKPRLRSTEDEGVVAAEAMASAADSVVPPWRRESCRASMDHVFYNLIQRNLG